MKHHVIGVDPSLTSTGLAFDNGQLAVVKTQPKLGNRRLQTIYDYTYTAAGSGHWENTPTLATVEDLPKHAYAAGLTGMAQAAVRMALCAAGVSILTIPPAVVKKFAADRGNADKATMIAAWNEYAHANVTDDNEADAAWLREIGRRLMHHASTGEPLPEYGRTAVIARYLPVAQRVLEGQKVQ